MTVRVGAVGYLNARPLVHELVPDRFRVRFDVPSTCAELLHGGAVDVGLIPSIEYLHGGPAYVIVPGIAIASDGPVASVAVFSSRPIGNVRSMAVDNSSRTSAALLRVLCRARFNIEPEFVPMRPDLGAMLDRCDAALLIGDAALFADAPGIDTIDLGSAWTELTGLPFVWAFWAARPDALGPVEISALQAARDRGVASLDAIAAAYGGGDPDRTARSRRYLRDNMHYDLGERELAGLRRFYDAAHELGLALTQPVRFWRDNPL